jgi:hypothetical protein
MTPTAVFDGTELRELGDPRSHGARGARLPVLDVCSVCLRVDHGDTWREASEFIRTMRTWELAIIPRFSSVLCGSCTRTSSDHPHGDGAPGQARGQALNISSGLWHALAPSGRGIRTKP